MKIKMIGGLLSIIVFASTSMAVPIEIVREGNQHNGIRGSWNNAKTGNPELRNWNTTPDAVLGGYSRTAISNAINTITNSYGEYRVNILLTKPSWRNAPPEDLSPVAGVFTVAPPEPYDIDDFWNMGVTGHRMNRSGQGPSGWPDINWADANGSYSNLRLLAGANANSGLGVLYDELPFEVFYDEDSFTDACWRIRISIPREMIEFYLENTGATGMFVSSTGTTQLQLYNGTQWVSGHAFLVIEIAPPPPPPPPGTVLMLR